MSFHDSDAHAAEAQTEADSNAPPCVEALLAGTLALLTGHAQACCDDHRQLMAAKAASNLMKLSQHPLLSEGFKSVAWNLHQQWAQRGQPAGLPQPTAPAAHDKAISSRALWHTTPETVQ